MKTKPCPKCGTTAPRGHETDSGLCSNEKGCNARRCDRRRAEDKLTRLRNRVSYEQCMANLTPRTRSAATYYCELHRGHDGLHLAGSTREWL